MKQKLIAFGIVGAFAISTANADSHGKGVVGDKGVAEEAVAVDDSLGATISAGYMSKYVFYGADVGDHGIWAGIDYSLADFGVPIDIGVWYINTVDPSDYDELDLYAGYALPSVAGFDLYATFLAYLAPQDAFDTTYELNLAVSRSLGPVDWSVSSHYDFELEAWYFQTGIEKGIGVTDNIDVVLSTGIAYSIDYFTPGSNWNHVFVQAAIPIALTSRATLEPYIGGIWSLDALDPWQGDFVHGGVSLSVEF